VHTPSTSNTSRPRARCPRAATQATRVLPARTRQLRDRPARRRPAGQVDNGYALIRPPGHHATAGQGMGFCLFNNLAVAIAHLQSELGVGRAAVVGSDVHHGNGTQSIFLPQPRGTHDLTAPGQLLPTQLRLDERERRRPGRRLRAQHPPAARHRPGRLPVCDGRGRTGRPGPVPAQDDPARVRVRRQRARPPGPTDACRGHLRRASPQIMTAVRARRRTRLRGQLDHGMPLGRRDRRHRRGCRPYRPAGGWSSNGTVRACSTAGVAQASRTPPTSPCARCGRRRPGHWSVPGSALPGQPHGDRFGLGECWRHWPIFVIAP
jgi:hypothetical protein